MSSKNIAEKSTPKKNTSGIFQDVINSIFEPGVNHGVLVVMNCAFLGLFLILFYLIYATNFNIHVCLLTGLSAGLFFSINWFIKEIAATKTTAAPSPSSPNPNPKKHKKL